MTWKYLEAFKEASTDLGITSITCLIGKCWEMALNSLKLFPLFASGEKVKDWMLVSINSTCVFIGDNAMRRQSEDQLFAPLHCVSAQLEMQATGLAVLLVTFQCNFMIVALVVDVFDKASKTLITLTHR